LTAASAADGASGADGASRADGVDGASGADGADGASGADSPCRAGGGRRRVVLISGAPGAGKSTLAGPLAGELGFALLTKDRIKETLHNALAPGAQHPGALDGPGLLAGRGLTTSLAPPGVAPEPAVPGEPAAGPVSLAWSRWLGGASMELLWTLAGDMPDVVLEANFRPRMAYERGRIMALDAAVVEVNCSCPAALAADRYNARAVARHPVHVVSRLTPEQLAEYDRPIGIGSLISVDTAGAVDVAELASAIRALLPAPAESV
jgi:predicted kinase